MIKDLARREQQNMTEIIYWLREIGPVKINLHVHASLIAYNQNQWLCTS